MGGNGTASVNGSIASSERQYVSHGTYHDPVYGNIEIVEWTGGDKNKSPEESNSAPRMYVTFYKDGSGVNEIAKYGADHKKEWAIHTQPHNSKKAQKKGEAIDGPHIHRWENGRALKPERFSPNDPRIALLQRVQNFQKTKK
jgi:hypothetical protein